MIMHDCTKTRERLVDLLFDELGDEARRHAMIEIEGCPDCMAQYVSMTETLHVFDQAAETAMPDESYWPGYEAGLRDRLSQEGPGLKLRLERWIRGLLPLTARPLQLAAGLSMVMLAIGWWSWYRWQTVRTQQNANNIARSTPSPQPPELNVSISKSEAPSSKSGAQPSIGLAGGQVRNKKRPPKAVTPTGFRLEERGVDIVKNNVVSRGYDQPLITASLFSPETIRHFEKAQLMLRSFRNAEKEKISRARGPIDLDYEKQFSRRLLYQNILLRRDAEMKGDLPSKEALGALEPFLLDIANLPDNPSRDELRGIGERLQRKEMIASLQISSARPAGPIYQNP